MLLRCVLCAIAPFGLLTLLLNGECVQFCVYIAQCVDNIIYYWLETLLNSAAHFSGVQRPHHQPYPQP